MSAVIVTNLEPRRAVVESRDTRGTVIYAKAAPGPRGAQGAASEGAFYEHLQGVPSTTWTITHNLGFKPNISVFENTGDIVDGYDVDHVDTSQVVLTFAHAIDGKALLS